MSVARLEALLTDAFDAARVRAVLKHYQEMVQAFQQGDWEGSIGKSGKLVEAALKALWLHAGKTLPPPRQFKAGTIIRDLKGIQGGTLADVIRITIPRACEFLYDIASNRGARHDPEEVNPNEQDANALVSASSWILAEMLRYSQKGKLTQSETSDLIVGLVQRRFPVVEEVDGRTYFHIPGIGARQLAILALWRRHPARMKRAELLSTLYRHQVTETNAATALSRIAAVVDVDTSGGMRLLQPGIVEAENLLQRKPKR